VSAQPKRSRSRRLAWGAALALAAVAIGWQVAKHAVDVEPYRPQIEAALEEYTGLRVAIGALELAWHPLPCLSAHDVSIGQGDFRAVAARLDVYPRLAPLLRLRVETARVNLVEPAITLPAARDRLESQWRSVVDHIETARAAQALRAEAGSTGPEIRIDELFAERALLHFGPDDAHPIQASITATGIGGDQLEVALEAEIPGTRAQARGTLRVPFHEGSEGAGELTIRGVRPDAFAELPEFAHTEWQARVAFGGQLAGGVALSIEGRFKPLARRALGGSFSGHARIAPGGTTHADLEITGDGLEIQGTARPFAGELSRVRIQSARAHGAALVTLLSAIGRNPVELRGASGAALEVRDLGVSIASAPRLTSGALAAHELQQIQPVRTSKLECAWSAACLTPR
jgi:hypothetical protein